jgi:LysR family glycine cleavage system transcriptional activator
MSRKLPSLKALRAFEAAARHLSFTDAAEELFVTHAAISRHIRDLELWLNSKLFVRTGRGVELTETGRRYVRELTPAFDRMARATAEILESDAGEALSISVEEALASRWLVPHLGNFSQSHPDIELSIDPDDDLVNFRSGNVDLAIRFTAGDAGVWPDVDAELLVELVVFPVCSPELIEGKSISSPQDITSFTLLHEETRQWWELWLDSENVQLPRGSRGPMFQGNLALDAAEAGQGFALSDQILTSEALQEGWLVKPLPGAQSEGGYYLVSAKNTPDTPAMESFRIWIRAEIAATQAWFEEFQSS